VPSRSEFRSDFCPYRLRLVSRGSRYESITEAYRDSDYRQYGHQLDERHSALIHHFLQRDLTEYVDDLPYSKVMPEAAPHRRRTEGLTTTLQD
jgi:hypothetical protein